MIIMIKLSEESKNILINYYKIELKEKYNIRIYKDMNIFKFNELLGIAMTNYNFNFEFIAIIIIFKNIYIIRKCQICE